MKQTFFISLLVFLFSCNTKNTNTGHPKAVSPKKEAVQLIFLSDRSQSFVSEYVYPNPGLFKPLCDHIGKSRTLSFYYGCITDNSNTVFARYFVPYSSATDQENSNPWLDKGETANTVMASDTNWNVFASDVSDRLSYAPSKSSDVVNALNRALLVFSEEEINITKKILLVCSDFKDTRTNTFPTIPQDIEIIVVGVLPNNQIEKKLHHKVKRFENLGSAINYISSLF